MLYVLMGYDHLKDATRVSHITYTRVLPENGVVFYLENG
jgi:hypothetical protein